MARARRSTGDGTLELVTQRSASVRRRPPRPAVASSPSARDKLRTVLIRDDRDEIAQVLLRYGDANSDGWAERDRHLHRCTRTCGGTRCGCLGSWMRRTTNSAGLGIQDNSPIRHSVAVASDAPELVVQPSSKVWA